MSSEREQRELQLAIRNVNILEVTRLLDETTVNANGKVTGIGYKINVPLTIIDTETDIRDMATLLLSSGADINGFGTNYQTLIYKCFVMYALHPSEIVINNILFLISKGANASISYVLYKTILRAISNKYKIIREILSVCSYNDTEFIPIKPDLETCTNKHIILRLAKLLQIPVTDFHKTTEFGYIELCECIKLLLRSRQEVDKMVDNLKDLRENLLLEKFGQKCELDTTMFGDEFSDFPSSEIMGIKDSSNRLWCFHVSEIPSILSSGTNPYNRQPIEKDDLKRLAEQLDYVPISTIDEAYDKIETGDLRYESLAPNLLEDTERLLKAANQYIDLGKIINEGGYSMLTTFKIYCKNIYQNVVFGIYSNDISRSRINCINEVSRLIKDGNMTIFQMNNEVKAVTDYYNIFKAMLKEVGTSRVKLRRLITCITVADFRRVLGNGWDNVSALLNFMTSGDPLLELTALADLSDIIRSYDRNIINGYIQWNPYKGGREEEWDIVL